MTSMKMKASFHSISYQINSFIIYTEQRGISFGNPIHDKDDSRLNVKLERMLSVLVVGFNYVWLIFTSNTNEHYFREDFQ